MPADWKAELEKMKKETEEEVAKAREEERKLREKYEDEKEKIIELILAQLKPVVETFKIESEIEGDQPEIRKHAMGVELYLPIVSGGTTYGLSMTFGFTLTDNGYAVRTRKSGYDHTKDRIYSFEGVVEAPVTAEGIQNEIREFIRERNFAIKMLEEKRRRMERKLG